MLKNHFPFVFASCFFLLFLGYAVLKTQPSYIVAVPLLGIVFILFGLWSHLPQFQPKSFSLFEGINIISAHFIGAINTFLLIQNAHFTTIIASAVAGLIGYFVSQVLVKQNMIDLAPNIYCGSFVGMVAVNVLNLAGVSLAGMLSGVLFLFLACRFNGCGGKLGSIAFMSCVCTVFLLKLATFL